MNSYGLRKGDKITTFSINGMAMTSKYEITVDHETDTHIVFKFPRKRKFQQMKKSDIILLFIGHNILIKADSDGSCMRGNACVNLVSTFDKEDVRQFIEDECRTSITEKDKAHILLFTQEQADDSNHNECLENCLYPDAENSSSLIDGFRGR